MTGKRNGRKAVIRIMCCTLILALALTVLTGCADEASGKGKDMKHTYTQISQEEAARMMRANDDHVIVDVRRQDEYEEGHIPGAILIPNETIGTEPPALLPHLDQVILIYCRSGNRSKDAAQKLADMGYTNVYEFGGILDWTGEIETGIDPDPMEPVGYLVMEINGVQFFPDLEDNSSAEAFLEKVKAGPLELILRDYGGFEKAGDLPWDLPRNDETITTSPGDIIRYQGNTITVYYAENTWSLTRLGRIDTDEEELREVLGDGDAVVRFWVEWTE